ncbi:MAG: DUF2306 domain-containing protein [Longimicrobiales bacterium]
MRATDLLPSNLGDRRTWPRLASSLVGYGALALLVLLGWFFINRDALKYLTWSPDVYQRFWPQRWLLVPHVVTAGAALLLGALQFIKPIRQRWPRFHRTIGWLYVVAGLVGAPLAFRLSMFSSCLMCIPPFALWSVMWFIATLLAIVMAVRRDFEAHRQFMLRSYVLMNGFVFVRLDTHLPYPLPEGPGVDRPAMIIWVAWVVPLLVTELWLSWRPLALGRRRQKVARDRQEGTVAAEGTP